MLPCSTPSLMAELRRSRRRNEPSPERNIRLTQQNSLRIVLSHESLDVTPAYLKGNDSESEEAQEHANSSSLALYV